MKMFAHKIREKNSKEFKKHQKLVSIIEIDEKSVCSNLLALPLIIRNVNNAKPTTKIGLCKDE